MIKKIIFVMIMVMFMVIPVSANVTYQDDYYNLKNIAASTLQDSVSSFTVYQAIYYSCRATMYQLQSQTILMEKQNELLDEQNNLMRQQMNSTFNCDPYVIGIGNGLHYRCRYEANP
jgi:hypothetical protein